jgi:hypothetical protein
VLPEAYEARLDETIHLVDKSEEVIKLIYPDVAVSQARKRPRTSSLRPGTTMARIKILHRPDRVVVAILEMLSPANKVGEGLADFCAKRLAILRQQVHLVELDLLVGGQRLPFSEPLPPGDYYAMISRSNQRPDCEVYAWSLRQPLPTIPIPLRNPDPDVSIDLGPVFRTAFARGRYGRSLPYHQSPRALLNEEDKQWAAHRARRK